MAGIVLNDPRGNYRVNSGRHGLMSDAQRKLIEEALEVGEVSVNELALAAGVSSRTIVRMRAAKRKAAQDAQVA